MSPRLLVTRPAEQAPGLCDALTARGISPVPVPTVAIDRDGAAPAIDAMLASLAGADWLVITSRNGAEAVHERLDADGRAIPDGVRVAAVGPATAAALRDAGIRVDHVPDRYLTAAIAEGVGDVRGRRIVLARAESATPDLRDALLDAGAVVEEVVVYRTVEGPADSRDRLHHALQGELDGIAFTSASTVRGLLRLASSTDRHRARAIPAFCIGPVTAGAARRSGFDVEAVAEDHTASGLATAIAHHFATGDQ